MTEAVMVLPILPGKRPVLDAFAAAILSPRLAEYEESQISVIRESWFVQATPMGEMLVVYFEAPDIEAVLSGLAESDEPFDVWFRAQALEITGVDLAVLPPGICQQIFKWRRK